MSRDDRGPGRVMIVKRQLARVSWIVLLVVVNQVASMLSPLTPGLW